MTRATIEAKGSVGSSQFTIPANGETGKSILDRGNNEAHWSKNQFFEQIDVAHGVRIDDPLIIIVNGKEMQVEAGKEGVIWNQDHTGSVGYRHDKITPADIKE